MVSETSKLVEGLTEAHAWVLSDWIIVGGGWCSFFLILYWGNVYCPKEDIRPATQHLGQSRR